MGTVLLSGLHARYTSKTSTNTDPGEGELVLAVNYKAYPTAYGDKALAIALSADKLAEQYRGQVRFILAVPATEIARIAEAVDTATVYAQHIDPVPPGAHTGHITAEAVKEAGARGTLLNHSEKHMTLTAIDQAIRRATALGLETLVCADTPTAAAAAAALAPTMIAVEPPELIGTGIPVSKAKPEVITNTLKLVHTVNPGLPVLAGAGITSGEDAAAAVRLGAQGVLVASAVMKAPDPEEKMRELAEAMTTAKKK